MKLILLFVIYLHGFVAPEYIQGVLPEADEYPFFVSVQKYITHMCCYNPEVLCGGVILNENTVLTKASCLWSVFMRANDIAVNAGTLNAYIYNGTAKLIKVKDVITHPKWENGRTRYDVAVLKLAERLKFLTRNIQPVHLPTNTKPAGTGDMIGWGPGRYHERIVNLMSMEGMPVSNDDECAKHYSKYSTQHHFCVGANVEKSSCPMKDGNAFIKYAGANDLPMIVGFSGPLQRCDSKPIMFMKVAPYLEFIRENMN